MKTLSLFSALLLIICSSCTHKVSETLIAKNQLGLITPETKISELSSILVSDSIPELNEDNDLLPDSVIDVYNETGELSLIIEPDYLSDSLVTIDEIRILDSKYKTKKGLSIDSNFKMIYENYKIDNIQNSINNVILSIHDLGAYIVIDKKHLPSEIRFDTEVKIEANQIPNEAPIRYFWLRFED